MDSEEQAAMPLAGGLMQHGYQCGMLWGSALAAGAQAYRLLGPGPQAETGAINAAQRLVGSFRGLNKNINCIEITGIDKSASSAKMFTYFFIKGGTISCMHMAVRYAKAAFKEVNTALSEEHVAPSALISCSAILAQKMGASDMHTAMAAGFAGGIGLSGGACGALGAAIWITGMNSLKEGAGKLEFINPQATDAIGRFIKCTGYEFECSKIVGRQFEDIHDHAAYLGNGGCSKIIEALAAK